jgi:hypothetical protein
MTKRRREKKLQKLLCNHPYLIDQELLNCKGSMERWTGSGRLDIDFQTDDGWIVVECKVTPLSDADLLQLRGYLDDLRLSAKVVYKAYLIGKQPGHELSEELLTHPPEIGILVLGRDLPTSLAFSQGRHYFDAELDVCPYDGTCRMPGKELVIEY